VNSDGRIGISIQDDAAVDTEMDPFGYVLFRSLFAALRANLAGLLWIDFVDLAASLFRFARHDLHELSQPIVQEALVQAPFGGSSIGEVPSLVSHLAVRFCHLRDSLLAAMASSFLAG
jgi:hypothetical protein